jgi:hypothetical protein
MLARCVVEGESLRTQPDGRTYVISSSRTRIDGDDYTTLELECQSRRAVSNFDSTIWVGMVV